MKTKVRKTNETVQTGLYENEMKYKAEGNRLCDLRNEEYLEIFDVFKTGSPKDEYHPHGSSLQRDHKGKIYYFDSI